MKTLLVIDMQKGFMKDESKDLPGKIRDHIKKENYNYVLFSRFVNYKDTNFVRLLNWNKLFAAPETDLVPELAPFAEPEYVFEKSTYSIFKSPAFLQFLKASGVQRMDICGIESDGCVLASAFDGFDLGYEMVVLRDLMRSTTTLNEATEDIIKRNIDRAVK